MRQYGWWAPSGGNYGLTDVTLSSMAKVNYMLPFDYANRGSVDQTTFTNTYEAMRAGSIGSFHTGGAVVALVDGSVRFLSDSMDQTILRSLSTRAGGRSDRRVLSILVDQVGQHGQLYLGLPKPPTGSRMH